MRHNANEKPAIKRIVILGGDFGGVYAALHLERFLSRKRDVELCLVSRDNFFLFTPMLLHSGVLVLSVILQLGRLAPSDCGPLPAW
jgi:NADH dehydrogenase